MGYGRIHSCVAAGLALFVCWASPGESRGQERQPRIETIVKARALQREVSFGTRDGWTIRGVLTSPADRKPDQRLPGALLLSSAFHTEMVWLAYPGWVRAQEQIVTLRIDWRGRGRSRGALPFEEFSPRQRDETSLDVEAALDFLSRQPEVDGSRLGIAAEGFAVSAAIRGAIRDFRVRAYVLISGQPGEIEFEMLARNSSSEILYVVSTEDRASVQATRQAYSVSAGGGSELWIQDGLGSGLAMGSVWRNRYPDRPLEEAPDFLFSNWLIERLNSNIVAKRITLNSDGGWVLHANLLLPGSAARDAPVAAVVLLPTALSDRTSFHRFERSLARNGMAVLNLDWRGIGESINRGTLVDMPPGEMDRAVHDVTEAIGFLRSLDQVDPSRIGIVGSAFGAKLAMRAALAPGGIAAIAMLTPVVKPHELGPEGEEIRSVKCPIFLLSGEGFGAATRSFVEMAASPPNNVLKSPPGAILGHVLLLTDPGFEREIIAWLKKQLRAGPDPGH